MDFIANKIGDTRVEFNTTTRRLESRGDYPNNSKYIRVEMEADDYDPELLPFGFYGPLKYKDFSLTRAQNQTETNFGENIIALGGRQVLSDTFNGDPSGSNELLILSGTAFGEEGLAGPALKFLFPSHELRISGNQDNLVDQIMR